MNYQQYRQYKKRKKTLKQRLISQISYIRTYKIEIPFNEFVAGIKNLYYWIPIVWKDNNNEYAVLEFLKSKLIKQLKSLKRFQNNKEFKFLGFYFFERHLVDNLEDLKYLKIAIDLIDKIYLVGNHHYVTCYKDEWLNYHKTELNFMPDDIKIIEKIQNLETSVNRERRMDSVLEDKEFVPVDINDITMGVIDELDYDVNMVRRSTIKEDNLHIFFAKNKLLHKKVINKIGVNYSNTLEAAMKISYLKDKKAKNLLYKILSEKIEQWSV
jgi:hypothetical protein